MINFKLKFRELFFTILVGFPIGLTLYYANYNKITYELKLTPGFAVAKEFCNNVSFIKLNLYTVLELNEIINNSMLLNKNYSIKNSDNELITISFKSEIGQGDIINSDLNIIKENIILFENLKFNKIFKDVVLNCMNNLKLPVYEKHVSELMRVDNPKKRYNNIHLGLLLLSPMIIIYLFIISFKYIKLVETSND